MATIQPSSKDGLDITVEGPDEHPPAILHDMFEEVMKTGIWKRNFASRNNERPHSDMLQQEDNENSPPPRVLDRIPDTGIFNINNSGSVEGNYNGSNVIQVVYAL
ncbi:hypothetical protein TSUD_141460 [Trifolium subterraneum]|uniref:Uncharacterized protein n=1 Tax=Trifolium subterraneum TaxID=3900 RepID=A0A2Z6NVE9_TRISU|nr:hypothetical protein TSUD_141460 [Trifolium subterraneum]